MTELMKIVDGEKVLLSPEDIQVRNEDEAAWNAGARRRQKDAVNEERERRKYLKKTVTLSTGKKFAVDMKDGGRQNVSDLALYAMVKKSNSDTSTIKFTDADNVDQQLTNDEMIEVGSLCAVQIMQIHEAAGRLKMLPTAPDDLSNNAHWD